MAGDQVILEKAEFEKMTDRLFDQAQRIEELEKANKFLNDQIKEYNEKFAGGKDDKRKR